MAANPKTLLTIDEFARLAANSDERLELIDGEVISMPPPEKPHVRIERNLLFLLHERLRDRYFIMTELGYARRGVNRFRIADVAGISLERWREPTPYVEDAPELVIEVLSDSNTPAEIMRPQDDAFAGGALEFWAVESQTKSVVVSHPDGTARMYRPGQQIPLAAFGGGSLPVDEIFKTE